MKAIGYVRVSTEDQVREGISLDNQEAKIKTYADLNGLELTEIIRDEGISGKSMDRPGMNRINAITDAGVTDAVIVYKLDRLSRRTVDILNTLDTWEQRGIAFHSIMDKIDTKTAAGKFLLTILSALAQMERDLISERTADALAHKKRNHEWCGRIPFGYRIEGTHLVKNPDEMDTIQKIKGAYRKSRKGKRLTMRDLAKQFGVSLGYVHKAINIHLRDMNHKYVNNL